GEKSGRERLDASDLAQLERRFAVGRRADDRGGVPRVSSGNDAEILSRQCPTRGDAVGVEPRCGRGGGGRAAPGHCLWRGARSLERTQTLGREVSRGGQGFAGGGGS